MFWFGKKKEIDPVKDWPRNEPHPLRGFTNFGRFEVRGVNPKTGRKKKVVVDALNTADALRVAAEVHGLSEPEAQEVQRPMATERQIAYAATFGVRIGAGLSMLDASALICKCEDGDDPAEWLSPAEWSRACTERVLISGLSGSTLYRSAMRKAGRLK